MKYDNLSGDDIFWIKIWQVLIIGIITLILSVSGCTMHSNSLIAKAIKNGIDPVEAGIALRSGQGQLIKIAALLKSDRERNCEGKNE